MLITNYFRRNNSVVPINISPRSGNHIEYRASGLILFCEMQRISKAGCWLNKDAGSTSVCHHSVCDRAQCRQFALSSFNAFSPRRLKFLSSINLNVLDLNHLEILINRANITNNFFLFLTYELERTLERHRKEIYLRNGIE